MQPRAEDALDIPIGKTVLNRKGEVYVFIGWRRNTVGRFPLFIAAQNGAPATAGWGASLHTYHASQTETLLREFPGLKAYLIEEPTR